MKIYMLFNFLCILECQIFKHFSSGSVISRPTCWLIFLCSVTPLGWHLNVETCRSFNTCYALYFTVLNAFVGGYSYSKNMHDMSNIKIASCSQAHVCLLKEPNAAVSVT